MPTRLDAKTLEFLLANVDMDKADDSMKALITETKENAAAEIAKLQLTKERELAAGIIKANMEVIVHRDYTPLTIPACVSAVLISFAWNTETALFERTKRGVVPTFIGEAPTNELLSIVIAAMDNKAIEMVLDLDNVLLDDTKEFIAASLAVANKTDLVGGLSRIDAISAYSSWPASAEILSELSTSIAGVENGAVFSDEQATVEIVYNSAAVNKEKNGADNAVWYVNCKIGKGTAGSSGNGRKKGPRTKVPGYKRNADYASEYFVGVEKERYDKVLTDLVDKWGIPSAKYNMSNELIRIETANPAGPQKYTEAAAIAKAAYEAENGTE